MFPSYPHDLSSMPGAFPMPGYLPSRQRLFVVHHKSVSFLMLGFTNFLPQNRMMNKIFVTANEHSDFKQ